MIKNYAGFVNENTSQGLEIIGESIYVNGTQKKKYDSVRAYDTLFGANAANLPINPLAKKMLDYDIRKIESEYNSKISNDQNLYNYVLSLINTDFERDFLFKKYLLNPTDSIIKRKKVAWSKIMTNVILNRYLLSVYNYEQLEQKTIKLEDYLKFLVRCQNDLYFEGGVLYNKVLNILKNTTRKGMKNELGAKQVLQAIQAGQYKITENFKPLVEGAILEATYEEDLNGIDFHIGELTAQVKPLISFNNVTNTVTSAGRIKPGAGYHTDFYLFVNLDTNECIIVKNVGVDIKNVILTIPINHIMVVNYNYNVTNDMVSVALEEAFEEN